MFPELNFCGERVERETDRPSDSLRSPVPNFANFHRIYVQLGLEFQHRTIHRTQEQGKGRTILTFEREGSTVNHFLALCSLVLE